MSLAKFMELLVEQPSTYKGGMLMKYSYEDFLKTRNAILQDGMEIHTDETVQYREPIRDEVEFQELYQSMSTWMSDGHEIGTYNNENHYNLTDVLAIEHILMADEFGSEIK